jgi:IS605 OrfB family transposase
LEVTVTAKIKINPVEEQIHALQNTVDAYRNACNFVSNIVFATKNLKQASLHKVTYQELRLIYGLRSQMAQSVLKTVIAKYKTSQRNGHDWTLVTFKKPQYDLVWNRDYSLTQGVFSVNTLEGRIKVPFETKGMEQYFDGSWSFGTAKLVYKHGKWFLHVPMSKHFKQADEHHIKQVVGVDLGLNFIATAYDSQGKTWFFHGRPIKAKRAHYKRLRQQLQRKQTSSARRRLKAMGQRENRWMTDINHQVSKALVTRYGKDTLFVLEDLTGVRQATEKVRQRDRYISVSWSFYQLRSFLEYKARMHRAKVIAVNPKHTSQTCPKCGHTERANRNKKTHTFCCQTCGYTSNDDRTGAMNLHRKGIEYIAMATEA